MNGRDEDRKGEGGGGRQGGGPAGDRPGFGRAPEGPRLPDRLRLGPVRLQVSDLGHSVDYYTEVLGLEVWDREEGMVRLGAGREGGEAPASAAPAGSIPGGDPILVELRERAGAAPVPRRGRLGLYHFALLLPDRESLGGLVVHLGERGERFGASDHRVSEALYLQDPDGLGIEVYTDRPRSTWRVSEDQLVMATDPLDLDDLVRAAAGRPWKGMPGGTVVGHVHLHVGDLGLAEDFYHRALGFDKVVWSYPGALFLSSGGYHHHLGVNTWAAGAAPAGAEDARLLEWEIQLPSLGEARSAIERLAAAGHPVEPDEEGGAARDPWGTGLRVRGDGSF